jgi:hypothetical protein
MADVINFPARLTAAVPTDLAEAVRRAAEARGLTAADYLRGATMARLMLDGVPFRHLPNLQRVATRGGRSRVL